MQVASGCYLNLFDYSGERDIFIIFNEVNSEPTSEELNTLAELVECEIEKCSSKEILKKIIEDSKLECVKFGVQVLTKGI